MLSLLILLTLTLLTLASLRLLYILCRWGASRPTNASSPPHRPDGAHILISLGSGGHTAEMLALLSDPPLPLSRYTRRTYVVSSGDAFSAEKAREFEARLQQTGPNSKEEGKAQHDPGNYEIHTVPRARRIHQSLLTTPLSCLSCLWACIRLLLDRRPLLQPPPRHSRSPNDTTTTTTPSPSSSPSTPDLILLNGPATSLILVLASLIIRYFAFPLLSHHKSPAHVHPSSMMRTIYIESWARTKTPSLTLRIIAWGRLCDRVVVQHKGLEERGWGEWRGDIMR